MKQSRLNNYSYLVKEDSKFWTNVIITILFIFDPNLVSQVDLALRALSREPLPFPPPDSFSPQPWPIPERARRICACGSSSGLSTSLLLLFTECCRESLARTALSRIKQVVRLSHNFIVYLRPTAEHGASRNQQVSPGKRGERHRGCRRATLGLQLLTIRTETAQNKNLPSGLVLKPLVQLYLEDRIPSVWSLFPSCAPSLRPCSPSVLTALSGRRGRGPTGSLGARVTSGGSSSDCSCLHPSRQTQGRTPDLDWTGESGGVLF